MKLLKKYRAMVLYIIDIIIINSSYIISSCLIKGNPTTNFAEDWRWYSPATPSGYG